MKLMTEKPGKLYQQPQQQLKTMYVPIIFHTFINNMYLYPSILPSPCTLITPRNYHF